MGCTDDCRDYPELKESSGFGEGGGGAITEEGGGGGGMLHEIIHREKRWGVDMEYPWRPALKRTDAPRVRCAYGVTSETGSGPSSGCSLGEPQKERRKR